MKEKKNFNSLKEDIDNFLFDNKELVNNNSSMDGISMDLGRLDFSRNEISQIDNQNIQTIKIIEIRKNEQYGNIYMFLEKSSPFILKAKTSVAELLILPKHDALIISKNFPNIWRRIQNKSYHNLVSIKKLTFKILKQYYDTHYYNKNNSEKDLLTNLEVIKKSDMSSFDNKPSFLKNLKTFNRSQSFISLNKSVNISKSINRNSNKTVNRFNYKGNILEKPKFNRLKTKNCLNRNKLFLGYEKSKKSDLDLSENESKFSLDSNSLDNSKFKLTSIINNDNDKKDEFSALNIDEEKNNKNGIPNNSKTFKGFGRKFSNRNENENFTFKNDCVSNNRLATFSPRHMESINRVNSIQSKSKATNEYKLNSTMNKNKDLLKTLTNSKKTIQDNVIYDSSASETVKISRNNTKNSSNKNSEINFITLENVNLNFSKKIKKKLERRKNLQKLKELLKFQKLNINKNLIELYAKRNIIKKINPNNNLSKSNSPSNYRINSQIIMTSSSSEEDSYNFYKKNINFNIQSLKITLSESFEIKSSYKNFNILSKGEIIKNKKFEKYIENSINIYINKNEDKKKGYFSLFSIQNNKNKDDCFIDNKDPIKKNNGNDLISEGLLTTTPKMKNSNLIFEEPKHLSNKKTYLNLKTEKTASDKPVSTGEGKKNSFKLFQKELENFEKRKLSSIKKNDNELNYNIKNDNSENNLLKGSLIGKHLKSSKKIKEKFDFKDKKSVKSSFKDLCESDNSKNENKFILINKGDNINNNSSSNIIQINTFEVKKSNNCDIF